MSAGTQVDLLLERWKAIRGPIEAAPSDRPMDQAVLTDALMLSRECDRLALTVDTPELARLNQIRQWFLNEGLPTNLGKGMMPGSLTRQEAVKLLRDNPSGADLTQALAERFQIGDDDLLLSFSYVIREDVLDAAHRASQALADHPRGAIAKVVREDIKLVLDTLLNDDGDLAQ